MNLVDYEMLYQNLDEEFDQEAFVNELMADLDEEFAEVSKNFPEYRKSYQRYLKL